MGKTPKTPKTPKNPKKINKTPPKTPETITKFNIKSPRQRRFFRPVSNIMLDYMARNPNDDPIEETDDWEPSIADTEIYDES